MFQENYSIMHHCINLEKLIKLNKKMNSTSFYLRNIEQNVLDKDSFSIIQNMIEEWEDAEIEEYRKQMKPKKKELHSQLVDVLLVSQQTNKNLTNSLKLLRENKWDIVNSIMKDKLSEDEKKCVRVYRKMFIEIFG